LCIREEGEGGEEIVKEMCEKRTAQKKARAGTLSLGRITQTEPAGRRIPRSHSPFPDAAFPVPSHFDPACFCPSLSTLSLSDEATAGGPPPLHYAKF